MEYFTRDELDGIRVRGRTQNIPNFGDFMEYNDGRDGGPQGWAVRLDGKFDRFATFYEACQFMGFIEDNN